MAYTQTNFKSGAEFKREFKRRIEVDGFPLVGFQPGPFGPDLKDGVHCFEGPHYPEPHKWYVEATTKDNFIIAIKGVKEKVKL